MYRGGIGGLLYLKAALWSMFHPCDLAEAVAR